MNETAIRLDDTLTVTGGTSVLRATTGQILPRVTGTVDPVGKYQSYSQICTWQGRLMAQHYLRVLDPNWDTYLLTNPTPWPGPGSSPGGNFSGYPNSQELQQASANGIILSTEGQGNDSCQVKVMRPDGTGYLLPLKAGLFANSPIAPLIYQVQSALPLGINREGTILTWEFGWASAGVVKMGNLNRGLSTYFQGVALHRTNGSAEWVGGVFTITGTIDDALYPPVAWTTTGSSIMSQPGYYDATGGYLWLYGLYPPAINHNSVGGENIVTGTTTDSSPPAPPPAQPVQHALWKDGTAFYTGTQGYGVVDPANGYPTAIVGDGLFQHRVGGQWVSSPSHIWNPKTQTFTESYYNGLSGRFETHEFRDGAFRSVADFIPPSWKLSFVRDFNNSGVHLAEASVVLTPSGQPIPTAQQVREPVLFVPIAITFKPLGDSAPISKNKNPATGEWMPGGGFRIFPDAQTQTDTTPRNLVQVKVATGMPNRDVYLKLFDVDDPSPDLIIDPNDAEAPGKGDDNLTYSDPFAGIPDPPYFDTNNTRVLTCHSDAEGVAKLADGSLPLILVGMQPGDNLRVAVSLISAADLNVLQVNNSNSANYVPPDDSQPNGFSSGVISPMLTVWRKLNIEMDSMGAPPTESTDLEANFVNGTVIDCSQNQPVAGQSTLLASATVLHYQEDRFANGKILINAADNYKVIGNLAIGGASHHYIYVDSLAGPYASGTAFRMVDDDNFYLSEVGLPPALPKDNIYADAIKAISPKFAPACIEVVSANSAALNPRPQIPFYLNESELPLPGITVFDDNKDVFDSPTYWAHTVCFAYQPPDNHDGDPNSTESPDMGGTPDVSSIGLDYSNGTSVVFIESNRESIFGYGVHPDALSSSSGRAYLAKQYWGKLYGTICHEISHSPGRQAPSDDHREGGLMQELGATIGSDFQSVSLARFRHAKQWGTAP